MPKFLKKPIKGDRIKCKCGRMVIFDHAKKTTYHEVPLCEWYKTALEVLGGNEFNGIVIEPKK